MAMDTTALTLPSEMKHSIATYCTPRSLASLAQVHTSYQAEAERMLYQDLAIRINSHDGALKTLKASPLKALFVRSLTVEFPLRWDGTDLAVFAATSSLCDALSHMQALIDLRVRLPRREDATLIAQINQILCAKHLKLRTLHCNQYLDVADIIVNQPELQVVGIYCLNDGFDDLINVLEHTHAVPRLHTPSFTLFAFECDTYGPIYNNLVIYPAFSTDGYYPWRAIMDSIDRDVAEGIQLGKSFIGGIWIYLKDFSDVALVRDLVEEMIQIFPGIRNVDFVMQRPLPQMLLNHLDLSSILSAIPNLKELSFAYWPNQVNVRVDSAMLSIDAKFARAEAWSRGCPQLEVISFPDGLTLTRRHKPHLWKIFGQ